MIEWIPFILFFLLFAISHSVLAMHSVKKWFISRIPSIQYTYRIIYNIISIILLVVWLFFIPIQDRNLYTIEAPLSYLFYAIQLLSLVGLFLSTRTFDTSTFLGLKQLMSNKDEAFYLDEPEAEKLIVSGLYKYIRHPLYTFSLGLLFFYPNMTTRLALVACLCLLYFWIGSYFEERKLVERYGSSYLEYRKKTGRFIPKLFKTAK